MGAPLAVYRAGAWGSQNQQGSRTGRAPVRPSILCRGGSPRLRSLGAGLALPVVQAASPASPCNGLCALLTHRCVGVLRCPGPPW